MANPMLIQKQMKDNSEDLHNFVRDLKLWEEEMKRKDRQLSSGQNEEILPPVRRSKLSDKTPAKKKDTDAKARIHSHDYKSWEKFDVDKACEEIDNEDNTNEEEENEESAQQEEKYLREKALYEKELGNRHVKACKWDEAINAYTRAIEAYPRDPIFFANRALCYLKKKKYDAVEADCTQSLKLDSTYVKAYLRRAAAHEALHRLEDARHDLRQVLQLEPNNSQAQRDLARVTAAIATVGKRKSTINETMKKESKPHQDSKIESTTTKTKAPSPSSSQGITNSNAKDIINSNQSLLKSELKKIEVTKSIEEPGWKPCSNIVQPVSKPPHLRSKKYLKRIEIHDVGLNCSEHVCARKLSKSPDVLDTSQPSTSTAAPPTLAPAGATPRSVLTMNTPAPLRDVPPPSKTSVQFYKSWNSIKNNQSLCFHYLKQMPGEDLPEIFKESLESRMFSSIVEVLASQFTAADCPVLPYVKGLSAVRRFSTIVLFMSPTDKSNVSKLLDYCKNKGECSEEEVNQLRRLYEIVI